ncbi:MAG: TusE/DsrC/DsvC family sulfur relay protein [Gammaproteobacteria bacterium]|nr:TusE/DsrC/DsvC family sulfur relay protein [Gammaproteobacteria bacterium]
MSLAVATPAAAGVRALPLDEDGFLLDRRLWDKTLAQRLANDQGMGKLGATQWMIIDYVRDKYFRLGAMPPMRNMCRRLGVDRDAVKTSFGSCRVLWQIAGLPNPGAEALSYMS